MDDRELLNIFWEEVGEYIERMNTNLMALEVSQPDDDGGGFVERLRELNRLAHSMKGAARAVGQPEVERLGYHMEEVLEASLKRGLAITTEVCDMLYDALDLVQTAADGETIPADALEEVTQNLEGVVLNGVAGHDVVETPPAPKDEALPHAKPFDERQSDEMPVIIETDLNGDVPPFAVEATPQQSTPPPVPPPVSLPPVLPDVPDAPPSPPKHDPMRETRLLTQTVNLMRSTDETVRVSVAKLDELMAESSELLVARMQNDEHKHQLDNVQRRYGRWVKEWRSVRASYIRLARRLQTEEASEDLRALFEFLETNQRYLTETARDVSALNRALTTDNMRLFALTDELQDSISALRLVPFETILPPLQRTIRDAARETNKEVHLDVVGGSTEIDKTVLEHLKDPIMHLLRNAVDHGIESAEERAAVQKSPVGWVYLNIETRGSEIIIHVGDDGRGIDAARVRTVAVERGVISAAAAESLNDEESRALIFHPGLTTRDHVTAISGRGVGMDVVRNRVESLRGRVSLQSAIGSGTTTTLSVPVSLTRINSVVLRVGSEQYAVPSLSVRRMERMTPDAIFYAEGQRMITVGDDTLPLIYLADMLAVPMQENDANDEFLRVMVLQASDRQVAFAVDEMLSEQELVLKPLGVELDSTRYVSGAALLGNGQVLIVLDANDLVRGAVGSPLPMRRTMPVQPEAEDTEDSLKLRVLIVDDSITTRTLEKNILETAGCDVRVAFDGVQAWELLNEHTFDVVVSDVEMPRMTGLALCERIKSSPATRHVPVILLTSLDKPEQEAAGLKAGADAYLVKQRFDQDELLKAIQRVL